MKRPLILFFILIFAASLAAACGGGSAGNDVTIDLAVTQTLQAIAEQQETAATQPPPETTQPEESSTEEPTGTAEEYPAQEACDLMAGLAAQHLGIPVSISAGSFDNPSGLKGDGCSVVASTDGSLADLWGGRTSTLRGQIEANGWVDDAYFVAVGIGGFVGTYRNDGFVCEYVNSVGPASNDLCNEDEPIWDCMDRLPDEDKEYMVMINCTPDQQTNYSGMGPDFQYSGTRIEFSAGAISQIMPGSLETLAVERFVLQASEGQMLSVTLATEPTDGGALSVWGEDGEVYLSGKEDLTEWSMTLPKDQDYYVDIKNNSDGDMDYQLTFEIK